jgi:hypothetical protein
MTFVLALLLAGGQVYDEKAFASELAILDLRLDVSTVRTVLDPTDLLPLNIRWTNPSKVPVKLHTLLIKVFMEEPAGRTFQARSCRQRPGCGKGNAYELGPGLFFECSQFWSPGFLHRNEAAADVFRRSAKGTWRTWVEFQHRFGVMKSNELEFRIEDDPHRTPDAIQLFGSEAWHRFALGRGAAEADLLDFRKAALARTQSPQKDIMAYMVGLHDLNRERARPGHALTLFRIAAAAATRNVSRALLSSALAQCHGELGNLDEALAVLEEFPPEAADSARKKWDETKAGLLRAIRNRELFQNR